MSDSGDLSIKTSVKYALKEFRRHGWAESVLLAVSKARGQTCDCIPDIVSGLGGGLMVGEVCGAVSGGVLAIGLLYGEDFPDAVGLQTEKFIRRFTDLNGAVRCLDLIGFDISRVTSGDDMSSFKDFLWFFIRGGKKICNNAVSSSVEVLLEEWADWGK